MGNGHRYWNVALPICGKKTFTEFMSKTPKFGKHGRSTRNFSCGIRISCVSMACFPF